ncbi:acetyl-CoA carboxylase biotin carboxyl carrier protein subunit domain protein [Negativicoccus succinicivorans]|uniref:acetyl-CoA carboxylase biotin carboxyl carrier protein subunit domain protein n=1 Tax=Negativicoccus succinicivorans TaxID=620903 RepID=UPI0026F34DF3|nr:acetyl-CoA carboxylase biotin carboxyl carrier protein subunit domain protein [Negativicoccus succinicivorans]MDU2417951.1 acetyl-CoA carboxylase biotin carboxyl carrier protein subunit domain protein [Negativicoccus succinicivorans]MDU3214367.1 acetyl-CoA carboxylase biotin carboxyl carrier protein subunit domain protein [Negativicoccus succinicivorans]MDU5027010.1 acetyl-CoA carboxylase biotin carboxyl carrier protein subunit domain protein [Negativicoccus succinicivorans]
MKKSKKRMRASLLLAAALAVLGVVGVMAQAVVHTTVLTGKVTDVVPVGTEVKEGTPLVSVESLAGSMPAARATVDGKVTKVETQVGATINKGDEVAIVETK